MNRSAPRQSPTPRPALRSAEHCLACLRLRLLALLLVVLLGFGVDGLSPRAANPTAAATPASGPSSAAAPRAATPSPAPATKASAPPPSAAGSSAATVSLPVTPQAPPGAVPLTLCTGSGAGSSECRARRATDLQWLFAAVPLPNAQLGVAYGPRLLVEGGQGAYSFTVIDGRLPPGLTLSPDGTLGGTPTLVGNYPFTLRVQDASSPPQSTQQGYRMRVLVPRSPAVAKAAPAAPSAPAASTLSRVSSDDAAMLVSEFQPTNIKTYQFTAADLAKFLPSPDPSASAPEIAAGPEVKTTEPAPTEPAPLADQLGEMLAPLINVEYPTRELFEASLDQLHCRYFKALAAALARKQGLSGEAPTCPPAPPAAAPRPASRPASAPASDNITVQQLYVQLLPGSFRTDIISRAAKSHVMAEAKPVQWFGDTSAATWLGRDCGCAPPAQLGETHVIYPFWLADGKPQPMDFGLFRRIGYLGAVPDDSGGYVTPPGWNGTSAGFTRTAQRYGTEVDLVLFRRDWSSLLKQPAAQQERVAQLAATNAVKMIDTPPDDTASHLRGLLLPFWREPSRLYSGITVYFEDTSKADADRAAFRKLYRAFVLQLIADMRSSGKPYALNLVVPAQQFGKSGTFGLDDLVGYLDLAEPPQADAPTVPSSELGYKVGRQIQLRFVVPLAEPIADDMKAVRERIDDSEFIKAAGRNEFLRSVVPVLFQPVGGKPARLASDASDRLDSDLRFFWWNFGSVAFWPPPMPEVGAGTDVGTVLATVFTLRADSALDGLCRFVCPNRVPLRLLFQALIAIGVVSIGLYVAVCRVRSLGRSYLIFLLAGGAVTLLVAAALLSCDPALDEVRTGNSLFYALIAVLFIGGTYALLRPRVDKP